MNSRRERIGRIRKKRKIITISILTLVFIVSSLIYYGWNIYGSLLMGKKSEIKSDLRDEQVKIHKTPFTVLIMGSDDQGGNKSIWRPDALLLMTINPNKKSVKLLSIPRDTYTTIANTDGFKTKINGSAYFGGYLQNKDSLEAVRKTVEHLFNSPIDYYIKVSFKGFTDVIDILGGVKVNPKFTFKSQMIGGKWKTFKPGEQNLNGAEALSYVRMRKHDPNNDMGRNERQREVFSKIADKLLSLNGFQNFTKISKKMGENILYNLDINEVPTLINTYKGCRNSMETIRMSTHPERKTGHGEVEILEPDERLRIIKMLYDHLEYAPKYELKNHNSNKPLTE